MGEFKRDNDKDLKRSSADGAQNQNDQSQLSNFTPPPFQLKAEHKSTSITQNEESTGVVNAPFQFAIDGSGPPPMPNSGNGELQLKANNTGLPNQLKAGVENLSGFSLNDVNVHYNSPKPAQLKAHAYAQGTEIHLGAGQEKYLPHEAWHVVQQKQGRVQPTMQMKGNVNVNDDDGLEKEADQMGAKAANFSSSSSDSNAFQLKSVSNGIVQRAKNSEDDLKVKMGNYKFGQAQKKSMLHIFEDMTDEQLQEILAQTRKSFDYDLAYGFLERDELQEAEPQTFLGKILSKFGWGGGEYEGESSPEIANIPVVGEFAQGENRTAEQSLSEEAAKALFEEDEEGGQEGEQEEGSLADDIISQVEIDLGEIKIPEDSSISLGPAGKLEAEGGASVKGSKEGFKGEAKIEIKAGRGGKKKIGFGTYGSDRTNIAAGGTIGGHVGGKVGMEATAEYNPAKRKGQVKGKLGASLGASAEGTTQIMVRGGGMDLGKFTVSAGMMVGLGGEYSYIARWDGGELTLGSSGKASLGLGFTWGYKMKINTPGMLSKVGDKLASWGRWGLDVLSYLDTG